jgi:hypothetical protein
MQSIDQKRERRRRLVAARLKEVKAGEGRTPVVQNPNKAPLSQMFGDNVCRQAGWSAPTCAIDS